MPNRKMDAIKVQDAIVGKQGALAPHFKLFRQSVVESAHGTGAGTNSHQFFRHFSSFMSAHSTRHPSESRLQQLQEHFGYTARTPGGETPLPDLWELSDPQCVRWESLNHECRTHCDSHGVWEYFL